MRPAAAEDAEAVDDVTDAVAAALAACPGRVLVGFSGGLDSTVLLHAAARLAPHPVVAVHVDHGLHPESVGWAEHCRRTAAAFGADGVFERVSVAPRGSLEANARRARYAVFRKLLDAGDTLLLGHHRDDQVETVLLRRLQGRGSYGMPDERPLGAGLLRRPLLGLPRACLARYAAVAGLAWIEDPANLDPRHARNDVRHRLLPALRGGDAGADRALLRQAELAAAAEAERRAVLGAALEADTVARERLGGGDDAPERLRVWLTARTGSAPRRAALVEYLRQLDAGGRDRQPALPVGALTLRGYRGSLHLVRPAPRPDAPGAVTPPASLPLGHGVLVIEPARDGFVPVGRLRVGYREGGEHLRSGGHTRPLQRWFQTASVPPWERDHHPILLDDVGVLAVPGVAVRDDAVAAGPGLRAAWRRTGAAGVRSAPRK